MHLTIRYRVRIIVILCVCFMGISALHPQDSKSEFAHINTGYALQYLEKAARFYTAGDYRTAFEFVKKGQSYNDSFADFFYLESLCLIRMGGSRGESLAAAEQAVIPGLRRQIFDEHDSVLLLARLYTETGQYGKAVRLLDSLSLSSADRDYYYAAALYGLEREEDARAIIATALERWSFDTRFPRLFFLQERNKPVSRSGKKLADTLIRQLYAWIEQDPALAVYAAPFDPNPKENNRRLKVYRNMYKENETGRDVRTVLAGILAALRYGVIDEKTAVKEFFSVQCADGIPVKDGKPVPVFYSDQLVELCRIVGMVSVRKTIADQIKTFSGAVLEDENNDGIVNAAVFFEKGRPRSAFFDSNQDEIYEYRVMCNFGTPDRIITVKNGTEVSYDTYPAVRSIVQQDEKKEYTMRPLTFKWEPVVQFELDTRLDDVEPEMQPFFTLRLRESACLLQEHDFIFSVLYCDARDSVHEDSLIRTHFENGRILFIETKKKDLTVSFAHYRNGIITKKISDYDEDGFFEMLEEYNPKGGLQKISVDINKNKLFEYYEIYGDEGGIVKNWDENEDGSPEIQYSRLPSGEVKTVWKHRYSGKPVSVVYKDEIPQKLTVGTYEVPLIKEPDYNVYWVELRPSFSDKVAQKLEEAFKKNDTGIESFTVMIGSYELYAVRSGGAVFVQLFTVSSGGDRKE